VYHCGRRALLESRRSSRRGSIRAPELTRGRRPRRVAVIGVGHYRATLSPNSMRILPDENLDNGAVRDPNRDIAEDRTGIDDLRKTPVGNDAPSTSWRVPENLEAGVTAPLSFC
jgi:hypothetical protein